MRVSADILQINKDHRERGSDLVPTASHKGDLFPFSLSPFLPSSCPQIQSAGNRNRGPTPSTTTAGGLTTVVRIGAKQGPAHRCIPLRYLAQRNVTGPAAGQGAQSHNRTIAAAVAGVGETRLSGAGLWIESGETGREGERSAFPGQPPAVTVHGGWAAVVHGGRRAGQGPFTTCF